MMPGGYTLAESRAYIAAHPSGQPGEDASEVGAA